MQAEYEIHWFHTGEEFLADFKPEQYDLIFFDVMLGEGMTGMDTAKQIRKNGCITPLVFTTTEREYALEGYEVHATDYLIKPYEFDELLARIHALIRRSGLKNTVTDINKKLSHSGLELDLEQHIACFNDEPIELSNREWSILTALLMHPSKIFSKNDLKDKLYDFDSDVSSNTVEVYIHHLRAKLGKDFIRTIRGLGYRLG